MSYRLARRACVALIVFGSLLASTFSASTQSLPSPPSGAKVLASGDTSVTHGAGSNLFVPNSGTFYLDYAVESGKELMLTMLTGEQYQAISAGRKPEGQPVMKYMVSGSGTRTVSIRRGDYFVAFTQGGTGTRLSWRGSFKN